MSLGVAGAASADSVRQRRDGQLLHGARSRSGCRAAVDAGDSDGLAGVPYRARSRVLTRRFNGDPAIVGRTLTLNGHPFTVIGVASAGFHGTGVRALDAWVPVHVSRRRSGLGTLMDRSRRWPLIAGG